MLSRRFGRTAAIVLGYVVLFAFFDTQATLFEIAPGVSLWYPSAGLNLALVLIFGVRYAPVLFFALVASGLWISDPALPLRHLLLPNLAITIGNGAVAWWLRRTLRHRTLFSPGAVVRLIGGMAVLAAWNGLTAPLGYVLTGLEGYALWAVPTVALKWGIADWAGMLTLTPLLLLGAQAAKVQELTTTWPREEPVQGPQSPMALAELAGQVGTVALSLYVAVDLAGGPYLLYLCFLPLLWMALRHGLPRGVIGIFLMNGGAVVVLSGQAGAFSILGLQVFIVSIAVTGLVVGALVSERKRAFALLHDALAAIETTRDSEGKEPSTAPTIDDDVLRFAGRVDKRTGELAAEKERVESALDVVEEQAEQLRELDEMKSRFFANLSHELRTPLSLMLGPVDQLLTDEAFDEDTTELMEIVHRNAERMQRLVTQLLNLARYDAGHLDLSTERRELASFVEEVAQRFAPMADTQQVTLDVSVEEAKRPVAFDPDHMETVLSNLVRNALKYTPGGGAVVVRAAVEETEARLAVEDTGPGIPEEEQTSLFDRFHRGADRDASSGTGIGLALTKVLMQLHDGTVEVDSTPGEGSTFTARWPTEPEPERADASPNGSNGTEHEPRPAPRDEAEPVPSRSNGNRGAEENDSTDPEATDRAATTRTTILVVEDNDDVRQYIRGLLEPRYRMLESEDGRDGLRQARTELPDLVVADVMMPKMNGFEMLKALRRNPRTNCIPVVMLTARAEAPDRVEGLTEGAAAYVTKPFDAEVLTAQIDSLLTNRRQLRERLREELRSGSASLPFDDASTNTAGPPSSFEEDVRRAVRQNLADADFTVEQLADAVALSRSYTGRKVKETFGIPPTELIRTMRLEKGAELLDDGAGSISEVAYAVGFNSLSHFSRSFKEYFGISPSDYQD